MRAMHLMLGDIVVVAVVAVCMYYLFSGLLRR